MKYQLGDIWYAHFPLEEDNTKYIDSLHPDDLEVIVKNLFEFTNQ